MSLYAFHLGQIISTVLGKLTLAVNMVPLLEPESGVKRPKLATPKYDASSILQSPNHNSSGSSKVIIWF